MNDFLDLMTKHEGFLIYKWSNYPKVYDKHLSRFRGKPIKLIEIGVFDGGSLQLWRSYFGPEAEIIGADINAGTKKMEKLGFPIEIGDQANEEWLKEIFSKHGPFDIIIDDGSHVSPHQILTLEIGWENLKSDGVYICEDTHCSYRTLFQGGLKKPGSFIEHCKEKIDDLHGFYVSDPPRPYYSRFIRELESISFYDSMVVLEKQEPVFPAKCIAAGNVSQNLSVNDQKDFFEYKQNLVELYYVESTKESETTQSGKSGD